MVRGSSCEVSPAGAQSRRFPEFFGPYGLLLVLTRIGPDFEH